MKKIKVGIIGAAGYTGGELLRILMHHPAAELVFAHSQSSAGKAVGEVHQDLWGTLPLRFEGGVPDYRAIDLLVLCVGHGEATAFLASATLPDTLKIIDLSQDHRLLHQGQEPTYLEKPFVYGLPELQRERIAQSDRVANPGCFATAIQLALLPLAAAGLLSQVHVTGVTGSTGAGQGMSATSHFSWRANNIQAYKSLTHQHVHEVLQSLRSLQPPQGPKMDAHALHFIPWRGDFTRGIFLSAQVQTDRPLDELEALYEKFYQPHPFTILSTQAIHLKQVVNTNHCMIQLEKHRDQLVIHAALDNLLKGASGQAVQNMNLLFGLEETTGLQLKANYF